MRLPLNGAAAGGGNVLGLHGAFYDNQTIYKRYFRLQRDRRFDRFRLRWFDEYPGQFLDRFLEDPKELNYYALMGVVAASLEDVGKDQASSGLAAAAASGFAQLLENGGDPWDITQVDTDDR